MTKNVYLFTLTALLTGAVWKLRYESAQRQRLARQSKTKHPAVQTWEHEGGALPLTGSQMGPAPTTSQK
jgi:hypothetical protein